MRIIGRAEFLALPSPVVYSKVRKQCIDTDGLEIKIRNCGNNDWDAISLESSACLEVPNDGDVMEGMIALLGDTKLTMPVNFNTSCRDGMYDSEDEVKFAILDTQDIGGLLWVLSKTVPKEVIQTILDDHQIGFGVI